MTDGALDWIEDADAWSTAQCSWQTLHHPLHTQPLHLHTPPVSLPVTIGEGGQFFMEVTFTVIDYGTYSVST